MKLDAGIPILEPTAFGRPRSDLGKAIRALKVGDSHMCETLSERDTARRTIHRLGGRYETRKQAGGWCIWRTA